MNQPEVPRIPGQDLPSGSLQISSHNGRAFYEAMWRDSTGKLIKRRLGPAWLQPDGKEGWRKRRGRVGQGHLDQRAAYVAMRDKISEHAAETIAPKENREATFDDALAAWLDYLRHTKRVKPSTLRDYGYMFREPVAGDGPNAARIMRGFGGRKLAEIDTADIDHFLAALDREKVSARTVNKHRQALHALFEYATKPGTFGLSSNPVSATERRRETRKPIDWFEPEEVEAIARAAREGHHRQKPQGRATPETLREWERFNEQDAAAITVAAYTGLRRGEVTALKWADVDFAGAKLIVRRSISAREEMDSTKSGGFRPVPLADQAATELARLANRERFTSPSDYVFCGADGRRIDGSALRRRFALAQDAAGLERRRFHDLRHGFGSMAVNVFSTTDVQAMMGHARLQTTERYLTAKPRHDDEARLTEAFRPRTIESVEPTRERGANP